MQRVAPLRVALVHDWLTGMRGGERCLEVFAELLPDAPILTLIHQPGSIGGVIEDREIIASKLSRWGFARRHYRRLLPLFPWAAGTLPTQDYDLVISLSHCAAKAVPISRTARHVCYCFTPARYLWDHADTYLSPERSSRFVRAGARMFLPRLRNWDQRTAGGVHRFVAISDHVARRIDNIYQRSADVIHPPVDAARFALAPSRDISDHYLIVSALAPYKGIDLAIRAFGHSGRRLMIIGGGGDEKRLRALADETGRDNITFRGWLPDEDVAHEMARCRALIMPNCEDFGIVPLEAMAAGRPVIALGEGGALETVVETSGILFPEATESSLNRAVDELELRLSDFDPEQVRARALEFDRPVFRQRIAQLLREEGVEVNDDTGRLSQNSLSS